ncbi:MAG: DUF1592 domain-containing protein [Planctomycetota bacterium]|nr:DUF1592 domain-containing protein [Planctomycetota bacterium]
MNRKEDLTAVFLKRYCVSCHDKEDPAGERNLEAFQLPITSRQQLMLAGEMIDQLTLGQMPPQEARQPTDTERLAVLKKLRAQRQRVRHQFGNSSGHTVIRRLSSREYENTLATLMNRRVDTLGLTADFPKENTSQQLDNIGNKLVMSGFLLDQYFQAASRLVEMRLGKPRVPTRSWHFTGNFKQYEELAGSHRAVFNYKFLCLYEQPNTDTRQGGYGHIEDFLEGVPVSGLYEIRVLAQAMHRDTHYDPKIFRIDFSEPFQLGVVTGDVTKGHIHYPQGIEPLLGQAVVPDKNPEWLEFRVWLEAGQTPRFIFPNGPYESRASVIETNRRYKDEFKNPKVGVSRSSLLREGKLPHIRISEVRIDGPLVEKGGSKEEQAVFGKQGFQEKTALSQLFGFASKAYRRPLGEMDRKAIGELYEKRIAEGASPRQAALDAVKLILCSPSFLYLSEATPENKSTLQPFDLASRLSYALWSGPPDEELLALAESGRLTDASVLRQQVHRLLQDPRSLRFARDFLDSWLNLRTLGDFPPPRKSAWEYYARNLPDAMKQEVRMLFEHLLRENGAVSDFLDADYTYVNRDLALLYRLPQGKTLKLKDGFQRVPLKETSHRGGLLGMAAVLTVSANGVDTSPVTRGVWVSENILGIHPPPPPDVVPAIEANVRGAKTIREQLARHREDAACHVCHRNIDPLGFPLEHFDPIGRWRNRYPGIKGKSGAATIDASGSLPSGESFKGFADFRKVLVERRLDPFARHLIETLLSYSSGRQMEAADQFEINDILQRVKSDQYGFRTLVTEVLVSRIFRSR